MTKKVHINFGKLEVRAFLFIIFILFYSIFFQFKRGNEIILMSNICTHYEISIFF